MFGYQILNNGGQVIKQLQPSYTANYLLVGGGGKGDGGGGGAGGFRMASSLPVGVQTYPITVGGGGAAGTYPSPTPGAVGSNSVFSTITSAGGGTGAKSNCAGGNGGSGGGGGGGWSRRNRREHDSGRSRWPRGGGGGAAAPVIDLRVYRAGQQGPSISTSMSHSG